MYEKLCELCPSVNTFDCTKCKERVDYLKRKYRECIKHNCKTGSDPQHCPYYEELDSVLVLTGCRPMNKRGEMHMQFSSSDDDIAPPSSTSAEPQDMASESGASPSCEEERSGNSRQSRGVAQHGTTSGGRKRKGKKKTKVIEAVEHGIDRLLDCDTAAAKEVNDLERERFAWEREVQRNRLELEKTRLEFEMRRMEAEERRAAESRQMTMQVFSFLRPGMSPYGPAPPYPPYQPPHPGHSADPLAFTPLTPMPPGPSGPSAIPYHGEAGLYDPEMHGSP